MEEKKEKKVLLKLCAIIMIVLVSCSMLVNSTHAATASDYNNQINKINKDISTSKKQLDGVESQKSTALNQIQTLTSQIDDSQNKIDKLNKQISDLNKQITSKQKEIDAKQAAYDDNFDKFKERIVSAYILGDTTYLDVLLSSKNLSDVLSNWYYLTEIAQADKSLLDDLSSQKADLEKAQSDLEDSKTSLDNDKKSVQQEQKTLINSKNSKTQAVSKLTAQEKTIQKELDQMEQDKNAVQKKLQALSSSNIAPQTPNKYGYISPLAGRTTKDIYCGWQGYPGHTGVDFSYAGILGQDILAVKAGTVVISEALKNSDGSYRSYGEYIVIDHHDGSATLYAHGLPGSRKVHVGDNVSQGQPIMRVGTTGNSTGPHLHFEVRINGVPVNPTPYLP